MLMLILLAYAEALAAPTLVSNSNLIMIRAFLRWCSVQALQEQPPQEPALSVPRVIPASSVGIPISGNARLGSGTARGTFGRDPLDPQIVLLDIGGLCPLFGC